MSKIALRVYNREIETLIQEGHIDEAVAHCKHILKTYPKHLETYRLLGKAYLEVQRHDDAIDIFQRVLTSVPDDFVSHLGMSIIADERKNLEQAIWHMERAFEAIPSNGGVQAELRRLYGRRDGLEPPKIQLTRGALARMYIRGGQYPQAIQELKGVLQEEPDRLDLKILMAQAYFRAGQKVEATEVCNEILKTSAYCFDANRILVEILPGTSLESTLTTYKKRLQQLDPYLGLVTGSTFDLASVQDTGVTIERLDWDESLARQAESGWQAEDESDEQSDSQAEQDSDEEAIPDWMKQQGWGPSTGEFQEGAVNFDEPENATPPSGELAVAEIPDWLQAMAPSDAEADAPEEAESEDADMDWLSGISAASGVALESSEQAESLAPESPQPEPAAAGDDVPDWLADMGAEAESPVAESQPESAAIAESQPEPAVADDIPDWIAGIGEEAETPVVEESQPEPAAAGDDVPDWLAEMGAEAESPVAESQSEFAATAESQPESAIADDVPDWIAGIGEESETPVVEESQPEPAAADDVPDWLADLGEETGKPDSASQIEPVSEDDTSDWLAGLGAESDQADSAPAPVSESQAEAEEKPDVAADDIPDWLAGMSAEEEPSAAESQPEPELVADDAPDWVAGIPEESGQPAAEPQSEPESALGSAEDAMPAGLVAGPGATEAEQDEAFKWLEMLAAGQGAKPEELLTQPEERLQKAPDWVESVDDTPAAPQIPQGESLESEPVAEEEPPAAEAPLEPQADPVAADDAPDWLAGLGMEEETPAAEAPLEPQADPAAADDVPDWLAGLGTEEETPATEVPLEPQADPAAADDVPDWLAGLGMEEETPAAEAPLEPQADPATADDVPGWLADMGTEEESPAAEAPLEPQADPAAADDVPDWLAGLGMEEETPAAEAPLEPQVESNSEPVVDESSPESAAVEEESAPAGVMAGLGATESEQDEAFKWLEMLAAGQGAKPEELLTQPEERLEQAPGWVGNVTDDVPSAPIKEETFVPEPPVEVEDDTPLGELSELVSGPGTSESEQDESFKWLENLAASQGAQPEELLTQPTDRRAEAPGWVEDVENPPPPLSAHAEGPGTTESEQDESFKWLENLAAGQGAKPEELLTRPEERLDHSPDWVARSGATPQEEPAAEPATQPDSEPQDVPPAAGLPHSDEPEKPTENLDEMGVTQWLKSLDDEDLPAESQIVAPAESSQVVEDLPDWLKDEAADDLPPTPDPVSDWLPEESSPPAPETEADAPQPVLSESEESASSDSEPAPAQAEEPVVSEPEEPVLSGVEGPVLSEVEGPVEPEVQAPAESAATPPSVVESIQSPEPTPEPVPAPVRPVTRQTGMLGGDKDAMLLHRARLLLEKANLDTSMSEYARLIKKGKYMEEVIFDLQEATYSHPVDVIVWQTLGDAYMRNNRLQEALDAYTKAEELLR